MKYAIVAATALLAGSAAAGCAEDQGNWYCNLVDAITYTGVGGTGQYNQITGMDSSSGSCSSTPKQYSGSLSPFDEDLSVHIRGPIELSQFAVYVPGTPSSKKGKRDAVEPHAHVHKRGHQHLHHARRNARVEERGLGDTVYANINGKVVSWANDYAGNNKAAAAATSPAPATTKPATTAIPSTAAANGGSSNVDDDSNANVNGWKRTAYYNAAHQSADGLVFLNHQGGSGSGVFDYSFGNSLSYASSDGKSGASSPQILADITIPSNSEIVIMSDEKCDSSSCGYYRDGTVAYKGFEGSSKAFFFEFTMPDDGQTTTDIYDPVNMPAIWLLNGQIPRTLQYGNADCSCWTSGCGEFDIFEILTSGFTKAKSTLHGNIAGGDSNYFQRPTSVSVQMVVILNNDNIHIKILNETITFDGSLADTVIQTICDTTSIVSDLVSVFSLAGASSG